MESVHSKVIILIDIDCFYAQVEMLKDPTLYNKPLGIKQKNIIVTCNYPAREFGVGKLMPVSKALKLCPDLCMVSGEDLDDYRAKSQEIFDVLKAHTYYVERLGLDENYIDVTDLVNKRLENQNQLTPVGHVYTSENDVDFCGCGCHERLTIGSIIAQEFRDELHSKLSITCCAGIAHNKLLAKLVAGCNKPNKQTTLLSQFASEFMKEIKFLSRICGIGQKMIEKLKTVNVETVSDLQNCKISTLQILGKDAAMIKNFSFGIDQNPIKPSGKVKQLGVEDTFRKCTTLEECKISIEKSILSLSQRLIEDGRDPKNVCLTIREKLKRKTKQAKIPFSMKKMLSSGPVEATKDKLAALIMSILKEMISIPFSLNLIGITLINLEEFKNPSIANFLVKSPKSQQSTETVATLVKSDSSKSSKTSNERSILDFAVKQPRFNASLPSTSSKKRSSTYESPGSKHLKVNDQTKKITSYLTFPDGVDADFYNSMPRDIQIELQKQRPTFRNID